MPETVSPGPPTWQLFVDAIDKLPLLQQPSLLANLAIKLRRKGERDAARSLALRAWRQAKQVGDVSTLEVVHEALRVAVPRYHIQISTDEDRIAAWRTALAEVIRPDMLALEIGTGSGVLAMLAARAGADVVSCEHDSVMAAIAEEVIKRNGLLDRVRIVNKSSDALSIPADMPRAVDILLLDLFANDLFQFEPFAIIQRARRQRRASE